MKLAFYGLNSARSFLFSNTVGPIAAVLGDNIIAIVRTDEEKRYIVNGVKLGELKEFQNIPVIDVRELSDFAADMVVVGEPSAKLPEIKRLLASQYINPKAVLTPAAYFELLLKKVRAENRHLRQTRPPMIYDCFTFYNELELLKIRLETLYDYVDKFVIVELNKTHRGVDKPYYFAEHAAEFKKYIPKIICVHPQELPKAEGWTLENFQRNAIMFGLEESEPDDVVFISDLDEIPEPRLIKDIRDSIYGTGSLEGGGINSFSLANDVIEDRAIVCRQDFFYYFLNCRNKNKWVGSIFTKRKNLVPGMPQMLRNMRFYLPYLYGGWHFSYLGDAARIMDKLGAIVEGESIDAETVARAINEGKDLYGRSEGYDMEFISKSEIGLPNIEKIAQEYPWMIKEN